ncbi:hypothetical protein RHECNPAF_3500079 [Rhizobium etli CNPAF512]|nr:hypothetical protein RHECNPAF_3500079 [Rhizobium etli CNPAF512]
MSNQSCERRRRFLVWLSVITILPIGHTSPRGREAKASARPTISRKRTGLAGVAYPDGRGKARADPPSCYPSLIVPSSMVATVLMHVTHYCRMADKRYGREPKFPPDLLDKGRLNSVYSAASRMTSASSSLCSSGLCWTSGRLPVIRRSST